MFYETEIGDTWDMIAGKVYGDAKKADFLIENYPLMVAVAIFPQGMYVYVPELPDEDDGDEMPDWRL